MTTTIRKIIGNSTYIPIKIVVKKIICLLHGVRNTGKNVYISPKAKIINGKYLTIGEDTVIEEYTKIHIESANTSIKIGENCYIYSNCLIKTYGGHILIGNNCSLNDFSILYGHGGLEIGNNVRIAAQTMMIPQNHNYSDPNVSIAEQGITAEGIKIEDDVWIGAGVKILDGIKIGKGSVIGAGSVVTHDVSPYSIAVGSPAKVIKKRQ